MTTPHQFEPPLSRKEAAKMLGIHVNTLDKYIEAIPHFRIGTKVLFLASALDEWRRNQIPCSAPCVAVQKGAEQ